MKNVKYIIYKDFWAGKHKVGFEYLPIDAQTDFEALEAAENEYEADVTYLVRIMRKVGKPEAEDGGWKKQLYEAVMCKRSHERGWHANTKANSEAEHFAYRHWMKDTEYTEATATPEK